MRKEGRYEGGRGKRRAGRGNEMGVGISVGGGGLQTGCG